MSWLTYQNDFYEDLWFYCSVLFNFTFKSKILNVLNCNLIITSFNYKYITNDKQVLIEITVYGLNACQYIQQYFNHISTPRIEVIIKLDVLKSYLSSFF